MPLEEFLEEIVELEVYLNFVIISALLLISFLNRKKLYSERARLRFKENALKFKIGVALIFFSIYFYIIGELSIVMPSLGMGMPLDLSYEFVHGASEAFHLLLLFIGTLIGFNEVMKVIKGGV